MFKRLVIAGLIVLMMMAMMPTSSVFAAPLEEDPNPGSGKDAYPRVEKAFQQVNEWYARQGEFLAKSGEFISRAEKLIGKAEERGLDTSSLRSLLESFAGSIPAVQDAHDRAGGIISAHHGFDENGKVIDINLARQTVKDAAAALQQGRQAHLGKGKALGEAIKAFWQVNKPPRPSEKALPVPSE